MNRKFWREDFIQVILLVVLWLLLGAWACGLIAWSVEVSRCVCA